MNIILTHGSALEFWRLHSQECFDGYRRLRHTPYMPPPCDGPSISESEALQLANIYGLSLPLHVAAHTATRKREVSWLKTHVLDKQAVSMPLFVRVTSGLWVSCPALTVLQMATSLCRPRLERLLYELCGTFSVDPRPGRHALITRPPLLDIESCYSFLDSLPGVRGTRLFRAALAETIEGSASPPESEMAIILGSSSSIGACHVEGAVMNKRIDLPSFLQPVFEAAFFKPDLYWEKGRVAVEYDSNAYHCGEEKIRQDGRRADALRQMGITLYSVHPWELRDRHFMNALARRIARRTGSRFRPRGKRFDELQTRLFRELFEMD